MKKQQSLQGSSLAESMVALGLIMVGLLGIVTLYTRSFVLNREVVNETIAAGLAAEGIEVVKSMVDAQVAEWGSEGWIIGDDEFEVEYGSTAYRGVSGMPLRFNSADGTYTYNPSGVLTPFRRTLTAGSLGPNDEEYRVSVRVEWGEGDDTQSIVVEDHFFNWRP